MTLPEVHGDEFRQLFLSNTNFLDVRSEVEFEKGAFPGSTNLPILSTDEREKVGICYKEQGHDKAVELGHSLVSGDTRNSRVDAWRDFILTNEGAHLYCWRGGTRSALAQQWLAESGIEIPRIAGGYKALRTFLLDELERIVSDHNFIMVGGATGSAKTALVNSITTGIDLEGHANHRGSGFGRRVTPQPPQAGFENAVIIDLLNSAEKHPGQAIVLENEGRNIGSVGIPKLLADKMATSPLVVVDMPLESRAECILGDYVLDMLAEFEGCYPGEGFRHYRDYLTSSLDRIRKRLGGKRHKILRSKMDEALNIHESTGTADGHLAWINPLLVEYYDPMTEYQLKRNRERIMFRGNYQQVLQGINRQIGKRGTQSQ